MLVYSLLAGLLFGLYFSLIGLGLNLVFGVCASSISRTAIF